MLMNVTQSNTFWQNAYLQNAPKLLSLCRRYVSDRGLAEDLMHDGFVTAINKQDTYKNHGSFEGWLSRIVVNTVLMHLRAQKKWTQSLDNVDVIADDNIENESQEDKKHLILNANWNPDDLLLAIDQLPLHHRTVFNLYVFEKYSHQQIADTLQISAGTSKSHLARGRKKLQEILLQKALEMKKKDRKVAAIPLLFTENHFIDDLMSKNLKDHHIPSNRMPTELDKMLRSKNAPKSTPQPSHWFGLKKATFLITSLVVLSISFGSYVVYQQKSETQILTQTIDNPNIETIRSVEKPKVDLAKSSKLMQEKTAKSPIRALENIKKKKKIEAVIPQNSEPIIVEKQTIVVKKQVLKKDTLYK
jgi:RNA polymerase sigma factor (sigma-70 family)